MYDKLKSFAPLMIRLGLAVIFIYHGYGKVFLAGKLGAAWNPQMSVLMQVLVAWIEFLGGVGLLLGLCTRICALGIMAVMIGAVVTVTGAHGFDLMKGGYEYNIVIIMMCLSLLLSGAGSLSLDNKFCRNYCCKK